MTDDAVSTWALDTHKGIKKNTELLILLICAKLQVSFYRIWLRHYRLQIYLDIFDYFVF